MITTSGKLWFAVSVVAAIAAVTYALASGGEKVGTYVLVFLAAAVFVIGLMGVLVRDGDVDAGSPTAVAEAEAPNAAAATPAAVWPIAGAFGAGLVLLGLAVGGLWALAGLLVLLVVLVEWMVQGWAERATGDRAYNRALRNQVMYPLEVPLAGTIVVAAAVIAFSRVLLALPQEGSTIIAIVVATVVLLIGWLLASRPRVSSSVVAGVLAVGAVAVLGGGVVGAVVGEREFEHHGEEHADEHEDDGEVDTGVPDDAHREGPNIDPPGRETAGEPGEVDEDGPLLDDEQQVGEDHD